MRSWNRKNELHTEGRRFQGGEGEQARRTSVGKKDLKTALKSMSRCVNAKTLQKDIKI